MTHTTITLSVLSTPRIAKAQEGPLIQATFVLPLSASQSKEVAPMMTECGGIWVEGPVGCPPWAGGGLPARCRVATGCCRCQ